MMKRALPTIVLAAMLAGCSNEISIESTATPTQGGERITVTATQGMADTRLAYTDGDPTATGESIDVLWDAQDTFIMYSSDGSAEQANQFDIVSTDGPGQKAAKFTGDVIADAISFKAFHPTTKAKATWADCVFSTAGQKQYGDGISTTPTHLNKYHYMTAVSTTDPTGTDMDFTTHVAVLKFVVEDLPEGKSPSKLTLRTPLNDDLVISKTVGTDGTDGTETPDSELSLQLFKAGTADDPADYTAFTAYMAVLPTTIQAGTGALSVTVYTTMGSIYRCVIDVAADRTFSPGKVYDIKLVATDFTEIFELHDGTQAAQFGLRGNGNIDNPYKIDNAADLKYFFTYYMDDNSTTIGEGKYFQLTNDIEIATSCWPLSGTKSYFKGHFDGNNKAIRGKMISSFLQDQQVGFFKQLSSSATVSDLTISATIIRTANIPAPVVFGGVCGTNLGTITDCTNEKAIIMKANNGTINVGGIAGNNDGTITGCVNTGQFTLGTQSKIKAGGISGICVSSGYISGCSNSGAITGVSTEITEVGGICGQVNSSTSIISGCINTGTVGFTNTGDSYAYVGGICGNIMNAGSIYECANNSAGSISVIVTGIGTGYNGWIAGRWNDGVAPAAKIYDCCTPASAQSIDLIGKRESSGDLNTLSPHDLDHPAH